ncbi:SpoVR family protein [Paenibacillus rhizoplanae]
MPGDDEIKALERSIAEITEIATGFGLDFFIRCVMRYVLRISFILFGAYGMPTRFGHWSFGKTFHKMKSQYDFGLSKIYELVINSNPCYAFLLDGNSLVQNKLIVAHVLAHCDFFKNNMRFSMSNRDMVESMAATADRINDYSVTYGTDTVEGFIDSVLAIQEHIDPSLIQPRKLGKTHLLEAKMKERKDSLPAGLDRLMLTVSCGIWRRVLTSRQCRKPPANAPSPGAGKRISSGSSSSIPLPWRTGSAIL